MFINTCKKSTFMIKIIQLLLFFVTLIFFAQSPNTEKILEQADSYYESSDYLKAISLYEKYLKFNETDYKVLQSAGISYFRVDNFQKAKEKFRLAALYCPVDKKTELASYYTNLSGAYSNLAEDEKAYEYAIKAYRTEETSTTLFNAASMANNNGKCTEALKLLNESTLDNDNNFNSLYGRCYLDQEQFDLSIKHYEDFFENYEEEEATKFNMLDEKMNLMYAYLGDASKSTNTINTDRKAKIKKLYKEIIFNENKKEKLIQYFVDYNTWNENKYSAEIIKQLIEITPNVSTATILRIKESQKDFDGMSQMANDYLKQNPNLSSGDLQKVNYFRYLGNLHTFTKELKANNFQPNEKKLNDLVKDFQAIFEDREYADDEITTVMQDAVQVTLLTFLDSTKNYEEQDKAAPTLTKILQTFPNKNFQSELEVIVTTDIAR